MYFIYLFSLFISHLFSISHRLRCIVICANRLFFVGFLFLACHFLWGEIQSALDMNPVLPFVRSTSNAMPFNSVDLSLSASTSVPTRNNLTPSPRSQVPSISALPNSSANNQLPKPTFDGDDGQHENINEMANDSLAFLNEVSEHIASLKSNVNPLASALFAREHNLMSDDLSMVITRFWFSANYSHIKIWLFLL